MNFFKKIFFNKKTKEKKAQYALGEIFSEPPSKKNFLEALTHLKRVLEWIEGPELELEDEYDDPIEVMVKTRNVRFRFLLQSLERNLSWKDHLAFTVQTILNQGGAIRLLCQAGLGQESGFFAELAERFSKKFIPTGEDDKDLAEHFASLFPSEDSALWIKKSWELIDPLISDLAMHTSDLSQGLESEKIKAELKLALVILSAETASLGVTKGIRMRLSQNMADDYPFLVLNQEVSSALGLKRPSARKSDEIHQELLNQIGRCQEALIQVHDSIENQGVGFKLAYKLDLLEAILDRMEILLGLLFLPKKEEKRAMLPVLMAKLIHDHIAAQNITEFLLEHIRVVSKKIVEHVGDRGEHYIGRNKKELALIFFTAAGGGVIAAFMAIGKIGVLNLHWPLFGEGFLKFIVYSTGLLAMQKFGLTLATKQPAYTAAALFSKLVKARGHGITQELSDELSYVVKSQSMAALGNLLLVVPVSIILSLIIFKIINGPFMDDAQATEALMALHPFKSWTIPLAALTGLYLWISGLISGHGENWCVYNRIPMAVEARMLARGFKAETAARVALGLPHFVGALTGNLSLAFFLASTPIIGEFVGLPLDVRHVTLSSGAFALALMNMGWETATRSDILWPTLGLILSGFLNFGVSFYLVLEVALRAEGHGEAWLRRLLRAAFWRPHKKH